MSAPKNSKPESLPKLFDHNFFMRTISAVVIAIIALYILVTESAYVGYFITLICVGILYEWLNIVFRSRFKHSQRIIWLIAGSLYMIGGVVGFYEFYDYSPMLGLATLFVIWSTDIGAYLTGRLIGGPKIAPTISPGKTWSGCIGGAICAAIVGTVITVYLYEGMNWWMFAFFLFISLMGQTGDLIESKIKRVFKIKDSGVLIPGHGGIIDRLDSLFLIGLFLLLLSHVGGFQDLFNF